MLEKLELVNFQNHRKLLVEFSPSVTCVVGDNGAGKTAIMRALLWAFLNEPSGDWMIQWGKDFARVKATLDGRVITRAKGRKNVYKLDGEKYVSFGTNVPDQIAALVNLRPANIQGQFDPIFWFTDSPGKVSRELNEVVNLDIIDDALASAQSAVRRARTEVEIGENRVKQATEARSALEWVSGASEAWAGVSEAYTRSEQLVQETTELSKLVEEIEHLEKLEKRLTREAGVAAKLIEADEQAVRLNADVAELTELIGGIEQADDAKLKLVRLTDLVAYITLSSTLVAECDELSSMIKRYETLEREEWAARKSSTEATEALSVAACPLCGSQKG